MHYLILLPLLASLTGASFNLNTSGPDWDYVAKDLANTTSQTCKDAYSANIDCDSTLLGLVASMRPMFKPTPADLDRTCTTTCKDSLIAYVQGVKDACTAEGDKSQESVGGGNNVDMYLDPVEIVGEIFQYELANSCTKASNGTYCRYIYPMGNAEDFDCDDSCTAQFYQTAHDYPASSKQFNYYWLISRGGWIKAFEIGWERLQTCGLAVDNTSEEDSGAMTITVTSMDGTPSTMTVTSTSTDYPQSISLESASPLLEWSTAGEQSRTMEVASLTSSMPTSATSAAGQPTGTSNAGRHIEAGKVAFVGSGVLMGLQLAI